MNGNDNFCYHTFFKCTPFTGLGGNRSIKIIHGNISYAST